MDKAIFELVWETLGKIPPIPVPFLASILFVLVLLIPLARKALKHPDSVPDVEHHAPHAISSDFPTVITQLVILDRNTQDILHLLRNPDGSNKLDMILLQLTSLNKMLRRRNGRSSKLKSGPIEDDVGA